jgi:hypothetical protein
MRYTPSARQSFVSYLETQIFLLGFLAALLFCAFVVIPILAYVDPSETSFIWKDSFAIPFSFGCVAGVAWWGWYSGRIAKRQVATRFVRKDHK